MNANGTGLRNLTNTPNADEVNPDWSANGRGIVFFQQQGWQLGNLCS